MSVSSIIASNQKIFDSLLPNPYPYPAQANDLASVLVAGNQAGSQDIVGLNNLQVAVVDNPLLGGSLTIGGAGQDLRIQGATTKGSLLVGNGTSTEEFAVPAPPPPNGSVLILDSTQPLGVRWGGESGPINTISAGNNIQILGTSANPIVAIQAPLTSTLGMGTVALTDKVGASGTAGQLLSAGAGGETLWVNPPSSGVSSVSSGTNINVDNTNPAAPIVNFATPTTSNIELGVGTEILATSGFTTMSIDSTGLSDTYLNGPVEIKEDISVSSTNVIQTLSATDGSTYTNSAILDSGTGGSQIFISSSNPAALSNQFLRLEATMGGDFNIEHQSNTASRNLAITSNQNLTIGADNIDLSSTGRLIVPSLSSGDFMDYNTGSLKIVNDSVGGTANPLLVLQNNTTTAGAVVVETYKNDPPTSLASETIASYSAYCNANNNVGVATKTEMAKINFVAQGVGTNNNDGTIALACKVNSAMNNFVICNGGVAPFGEVQVFKPLDINGNAIKTTTGDLGLDATASTGTGNINLTAKVVGGKVISNSSVQLPSTSTNIQVGTSVGAGIYTTISNGGVNIIDTLGVGVNRQSILANYGCELYDNGVNNCNSKLDGYALTQTDNRYNKTLTINNFNSGNSNENRIDLFKDTTFGQTATSSIINNTSTQNIQFNYQDGGNGRSLNLSNDSASGGVLNYTNQISNQPFTIDSSTGDLILKTTATHALTLNSDILNLENTNTTTSVPNHTSSLATTSNIGDITTYLKLQLNGVDIWVPYFTQDPSI